MLLPRIPVWRMKIWSALLVAVLVLTSCGEQAQTPTPTSVRPVGNQPPVVDEPNAETSAEPTTTPILITTSQAQPSPVPTLPSGEQVGNVVLPQPLYFLENGQIYRLERNATVVEQITFELPAQTTALAIYGFDVSPTDGLLVYVIADGNGTALMSTDALGQNRRVLLSMPTVQISVPRWSPDGTSIALRIEALPDTPAVDVIPGVYVFTIGNSEPQLLQADDPADPEFLPAPRYYSPAAWSPDGSRLLLNGTFWFVSVCGLLVKDIASGAMTMVATPNEDNTTACSTGTWREDGQAIYFNGQLAGRPALTPGLWLADAATGESQQLVASESNGQYVFIDAARQLNDEALYFFRATASPDVDLWEGAPVLDYTMYRANADASGEAALRGETQAVRQVLWAEEANGAVVSQIIPNQQPRLVWLPSDGSEPVALPAEGYDVGNLRWGQG